QNVMTDYAQTNPAEMSPLSLRLRRIAGLALKTRFLPMTVIALLTLVLLLLSVDFPWLLVLVAVGLGLTLLGIQNLVQRRHSILRNYPIIGYFRFIFEELRPELRQYFFESDTDGTPFNRNDRSLVYRRAKGALDKMPFGTELDVYGNAFEWLNHSMVPKDPSHESFRVKVGGPDCTKPYDASVLNISGMSFGALSAAAISSLNRGARIGGFAHGTGEGSFSRYHREQGGDVIWQIASGYFGCRNADGSFSDEAFRDQAANEQVKMIELKLSQGAKPGHGGVLPAPKVSPEISRARGVPMGVDCISPPRHPAFSTPIGMMEFIAKLRELSGGKPVGFKLCIGHPWEFLGICKAMLQTGITPDFIVIDGSEGGTGAAPVEFVDHLGTPLRDGLMFVHNALVGLNLRDRVRIAASGKVISAFDIARTMALGADWCNAARAFMFAVGCIQSQKCHTDHCPTGVATQDPVRQRALVVPDKADRVALFHRSTITALAEVVAAAGLDHPGQLGPHHFSHRYNNGRVERLDQVHRFLRPGEILDGTDDPRFAEPWHRASAECFNPAVEMTGRR
ncbi:MAG TPA: FMN-binding glutamate synthase family protein, partial [Stellaceae bacterium]|nr:FMN-binding glutamate synthase family protein [Stellaceae bacterium]